MNKRGFFFILDAVISITLLIIGTILIYGSQSTISPTVQASFIASDILGQLSTSQIKGITDDYILELRVNKTIGIEDIDRSALEMIVILQNRSLNQSATGIVNALVNKTVSENYNFIVYIDDVLIFNRTTKPLTSTKTVIVSSQLVTSIVNQTLLGPSVAQVKVW